MDRRRSEYRLARRVGQATHATATTRPIAESDRDALAQVLLDAYRGTIDDEGEDLDDAYEAVDEMVERALRPYSCVIVIDEQVVGMSFVIVLDGVHYIDPVVVAPAHKRTGVGAMAVNACLDALAAAGISEVGATITDGNTASETLFRRLGFERRGAWT